ncbi:MAG: hypothetical protein V4490_00750, partial [Pseudomonadota bacterium]
QRKTQQSYQNSFKKIYTALQRSFVQTFGTSAKEMANLSFFRSLSEKTDAECQSFFNEFKERIFEQYLEQRGQSHELTETSVCRTIDFMKDEGIISARELKRIEYQREQLEDGFQKLPRFRKLQFQIGKNKVQRLAQHIGYDLTFTEPEEPLPQAFELRPVIQVMPPLHYRSPPFHFRTDNRVGGLPALPLTRHASIEAITEDDDEEFSTPNGNPELFRFRLVSLD